MAMKPNRVAGSLLITLGILTLGTALYFLAARPALLPEDIHYMATDPAKLPPELNGWLLIVFRAWGGFIAGFATLLLGIGAFLFTGRLRWLSWGTASGVLFAYGLFLGSNIVLASDFLGFIAALSLLALGTALLLLLRPD